MEKNEEKEEKDGDCDDDEEGHEEKKEKKRFTFENIYIQLFSQWKFWKWLH